jgi:hypothetical protein
MELTDKNATGNFSKFSFTKGENSTVTPTNVASFSSISIKWVASGTTAVQETALTNDIQIFPNPANNVFHVRGDNISEIEILNLAGVLVFKNNSTTQIDMTNFKNGIYLVRIKQGNITVVKKLVKE